MTNLEGTDTETKIFYSDDYTAAACGADEDDDPSAYDLEETSSSRQRTRTASIGSDTLTRAVTAHS